MIDFNILNKALKVAWIPSIKSENVASWKIIPNATLERYGGLHFLTNCNYDIDTLQVCFVNVTLLPSCLSVLSEYAALQSKWQSADLDLLKVAKKRKSVWPALFRDN